MPRGYRLLIISAGGIAVLTALGVGAFFGSLYGPDRKYYETVAGDNAGQKDYQGPSQSLPDIAGLPGPVERAIANRRPQTGQDHEKRDLAAQEASALWAFWMVLASFLSILITTVGTILLYQQIKLTREAVKDTGDATKAMREANDIAQIALENQKMIDDGRLVLTAIQVEHGSKYVKLRFSVSNIGRTDVVITKVLFIKSTKMATEAEPPAAMSVMTSKPSILKSGEITDVYEGTGSSVSGGDNLFLTIAVSYESRYRRTTSFMCVKPQDGERRDSDGFDLCAAWEGELPQKVALLTRVGLRGT